VDGGGRTQTATVLRVLAMLAPRHPRLHLAIVGPGSNAEDLRMHAAALRVARRVRFLGARDDQLAILARADLAWIVSAGDDGAYAALDAMGVEVPVLWDAGSVAGAFVPDGIAGVALPPRDAHAAAAEVARLLVQPERRAAMGGAGRVRVARDFGEMAMVDAFERAALVAGDRSHW
jgi:glycosyltransferase involved in cell wall biosynthesis